MPHLTRRQRAHNLLDRLDRLANTYTTRGGLPGYQPGRKAAYTQAAGRAREELTIGPPWPLGPTAAARARTAIDRLEMLVDDAQTAKELHGGAWDLGYTEGAQHALELARAWLQR